LLAVATVPLATAVIAKNAWEIRPRSPVWVALFVLRLGQESPFLYFQF
jgi:hypothetical protein